MLMKCMPFQGFALGLKNLEEAVIANSNRNADRSVPLRALSLSLFLTHTHTLSLSHTHTLARSPLKPRYPQWGRGSREPDAA